MEGILNPNEESLTTMRTQDNGNDPTLQANTE